MRKIQEIISFYSKKTLPKAVNIREMGLRDGLQNEKKKLPTDIKVEFVQRLSECGYKKLEIGGFVPANVTPQLSDSAAVFSKIVKKPGIVYSALVPNMKGYQSAIKAGAQEIAIFVSASEGFNQNLLKCSIKESIYKYRPLMMQAYLDKVKVRGYISCVIGCPYDGDTNPQAVRDTALRMKEIGCYQLSLNDNIGTVTSKKAKNLIETLLYDLEAKEVAVHFHNTFGRALESVMATLELGIDTVDTSIGSIGACPYADGAIGNASTEDLVYILKELQIETGLNLQEICNTANWACDKLEIQNRSVYQEHEY